MTAQKKTQSFPRGVTAIVPPTGVTVPVRIESRRGKRATVRGIFGDNVPNILLTVSKDSVDTYVDNVALSVFSNDRPLPVEIPEGDYKFAFVSTASTTVTVNLALITELE